MENIFQKSFDSITGIDIQNLIDIKYKERQRMEYKREMYGRSNEDKKEMLRDISSIANAYGGYLIIGIEADADGIPIKSYDIVNAETERNRIEQSCLSNIEAHIPGLKSKTIKMDSGESVIVVFIPRSLKKPHMVTFSGLNQFWIRHNDKKERMSVEEIREACVSVENVWRDVRQFLEEREEELRKDTTTKGRLIIGCAPALTREEFIDIRDTSIKHFLINPPNQHGDTFTISFMFGNEPQAYPEPTLNGLKITHENIHEVQLFRNGYYELRLNQTQVYWKSDFREVFIDDKGIVGYIVNYFRALKFLVERLGIESNLVAFICLYNVGHTPLKSVYAHPRTGHRYYPSKKLEKTTHLLIPPMQIISFDNPDSVAKLFLERVWNAFGFDEVPDFEDDTYSPKK